MMTALRTASRSAFPEMIPVFRNKKCLEFVRSEGVPDLDCSMGNHTHLISPGSSMDFTWCSYLNHESIEC